MSSLPTIHFRCKLLFPEDLLPFNIFQPPCSCGFSPSSKSAQKTHGAWISSPVRRWRTSCPRCGVSIAEATEPYSRSHPDPSLPIKPFVTRTSGTLPVINGVITLWVGWNNLRKIHAFSRPFIGVITNSNHLNGEIRSNPWSFLFKTCLHPTSWEGDGSDDPIPGARGRFSHAKSHRIERGSLHYQPTQCTILYGNPWKITTPRCSMYGIFAYISPNLW